MTNLELLKLAAKAAGSLIWTDCDGEVYSEGKTGEEVKWSPLTDDGDALRLAVCLGLRLNLPKYKGFGSTADSQSHGTAGCTCFRDDPMEQTRYAIVQAAANIGFAMP